MISFQIDNTVHENNILHGLKTTLRYLNTNLFVTVGCFMLTVVKNYNKDKKYVNQYNLFGFSITLWII